MKKKLIAALSISGLVVALVLSASASGANVTITGDGACAKCQLKEAKSCQPPVTAMEDGKKVTYYLRENAATKQIGKQLCSEHLQLKVTGAVQTVDGRFEITPTKVEIVKPLL